MHQRLTLLPTLPATPPGRRRSRSFLIETMEAMKLTDPNPHLDVAALRKGLQAAA